MQKHHECQTIRRMFTPVNHTEIITQIITYITLIFGNIRSFTSSVNSLEIQSLQTNINITFSDYAHIHIHTQTHMHTCPNKHRKTGPHRHNNTTMICCYGNMVTLRDVD